MTQAREDRIDPALRLFIVAVLLGGIMGILDGTIVAVAVETLADTFDASLSTVGWVSTGYLTALTLTVPVTSWGLARFGARRLWFSGLGLFLAASLASGLAWNVGSLLVFRVLQGIGAGIVEPTVLVLLARGAGPRRAGRVMGLMGIVWSLGPVLGPVIGGLIIEGLGWRSTFLVNLPIGLLAIMMARRLVPKDKPSEIDSSAQLDVLGVSLLGPGVAAGILALTQVGENGTATTWQVLLPLVLSATMLAAYSAYALRPGNQAPLIELRMFGNTSFSANVAIQGLVGAGTFSVLFSLPLYYQQVHGFDPFVSGLLVAPLGAGAALANPIAGRLSDYSGARTPVRTGALFAGGAAVGMANIGDGHLSGVWVGAAAFVVGAGLGVIGAPTMGSLYRILPAEQISQGSSVLYILNQLGAAVGVAVVAVVMQIQGSFDPLQGVHGVFWFTVIIMLAILVASPLVPGRPALHTISLGKGTVSERDRQ